MSEMVERGADFVQRLFPVNREDARVFTRGFIHEVMREPSVGMVQAGANSVTEFDPEYGQTSTETARHAWAAMIDAALSEPKPGSTVGPRIPIQNVPIVDLEK